MEPVAAAVAAEEFTRAGSRQAGYLIAQYFSERRNAAMPAAVEAGHTPQAARQFRHTLLTAATLRRFRVVLRGW